ncbi:MAG: aconitate hydratase AcnA [Acidobacteria bacterium]|nr:aconitate hydratase AcnA [Acidobacteriota bacterium]
MKDSFSTLKTLTVGDRTYRIAHLPSLETQGFNISRLPFSMRILLENLLRREDGDGDVVPAEDIEAIAKWDPKAEPSVEIAFMPARVLLQDFTGVPAVVDLAAMRDAMKAMGGDPEKINPLQPAELVIDHSVQVDEYGTQAAFLINVDKEYERNRERYAFLKWGQQAFDNFKVVPPGTGIVHQVNLEYLGRVVMTDGGPSSDRPPFAYPDSLVGTDSHTTMINGLGILGWGVGGIEAEAVMLGQPISMLVPQVVGFRLVGELAAGATATDLVLTVTQMLRERGVVGKFVEYFGPGLAKLPLADRATIANMSPEYGATCGIFPVDQVTLDYMAFTGRSPELVELVEAYMKEQGLFHTADSPEAEYSDTMELDLSTVQPSLAGPKRPQDRILLSDVKRSFLSGLEDLKAPGGGGGKQPRLRTVGKWESEGGTAVAEANPGVAASGVRSEWRGQEFELRDGSVVIAAITSCTNTSNPYVMVAAGLLAKKAVELGLESRPWVKTSLAPGSKVVTDYLDEAGLTDYLEKLNFYLVGYGCTTCIGNSGPLPEPIKAAIDEGDLVACSVLSGNRNFEGRIGPDVRANYLASPPLVVAYALAGRIDIDLATEPLGEGKDGPVFLKDLWPESEEVDRVVSESLHADMFNKQYAEVYSGDERWNEMEIPTGETYAWDPASTYVKLPPYFVDMPAEAGVVSQITGARCLALVGDSITTDHISPAGAIMRDSPAGRYLQEKGIAPVDFNSYGSRRGNHEVMMRGTFANVRFRNQLVPSLEGGFTLHFGEDGSETPMTIFDASMKYRDAGIPLVILAGKEYGTGSSRDWAAKGPMLLGVRAVVARSYERIHRSNLIGMGILPLEFKSGESADSLGLTGKEFFAIEGLAAALGSSFRKGAEVTVKAGEASFVATIRIDTPQEVEYYRHGGILQYVLRQLLDG